MLSVGRINVKTRFIFLSEILSHHILVLFGVPVLHMLSADECDGIQTFPDLDIHQGNKKKHSDTMFVVLL